MTATMKRSFFHWCLIAQMAFLIVGNQTCADEGVKSWTFYPKYQLPLEATNFPGPHLGTPKLKPTFLAKASNHQFLLDGLKSTHEEVLDQKSTLNEQNSFTAELWLLEHVNQPVGASLGMLTSDLQSGWILAYHDHKASFACADSQFAINEPVTVALERQTFHKKWWLHLALRSTGDRLDLFLNGQLVTSRALKKPFQGEQLSGLRANAFLENEPHMDLSNLVREIRMHDRALGEDEIQASFARLRHQVDKGVYSTDGFHFVAGPYLHYPSASGIHLSWETSNPARATFRYGTSIPLTNEVSIDRVKKIHDLEIDNLEPATNYYYELSAEKADGETIHSGTLTFRTAVKPNDPFLFALVGDTEARPHINDAVAKGIWNHRPNFVINLGDLTDGGQQAHKFEWNFEYFAGMTQLHSRIPVMTVPGNGESDLHWYARYHRYPSPENYYTFEFGNAQFFMLDSNRKIAPGTEQYQWLSRQLEESDATWKFVCHHHCAYSSDGDDYGDTWNGEASYFVHRNVSAAIELYEKHNIDVVFFGHVHAFERSYPIRNGKVSKEGGVRYVETGGGGGNLENFSPFPSWFSRAKYRGHHFSLVELSDTRFELKVIDLNGIPRDGFVIEK